ncbi:probable inactive DNA (cytosine-5)-methyltransferase DRM3 [Daucus carota subsp. sativus]|uniref:probable inactive DNA (cytosine-5)-methyltransferase DRM3 n=1 Tax=Daucus carota subsp. sativus TaxID=79200 RepID=UPI0007F02DB2|nr:PREDICTED: DNA (cytosine-5)-methyltransferase DRM2-like [Daucus carota subsp. sativus]XP_017222059.1 PREDICTED: DNA (cytosine-5)-methyltransferase DRM2-like [Daucus carota subsp. sativus]XP_017222060.1 PREDICTED: DNA (cytosine-5)-methyltransferase DRM2-like [Daucus carota subsp. sativus]XP_017222062.1 PREDICTED: DNA (cytosine-5)-methyltransferase DRM2-like [Daucus carota subsp. sativus]
MPPHNMSPCRTQDRDAPSGSNASKASLLQMNFPLKEVEFAIDKLGESAPIDELVDFILASQLAGETEEVVSANHSDEEKKEKSMDKRQQLLEMGFTEQEVSAAIEINGPDKSLAELTDSIVSGQATSSNKNFSRSSGQLWSNPVHKPGFIGDPEATSSSMNPHLTAEKRKRVKEEYINEPACLKKPKEVYEDNTSSTYAKRMEASQTFSKVASSAPALQRKLPYKAQKPRPPLPKPKSCRTVDLMVAKPPYFFYAHVVNLSDDSWNRASQFLYAIEPEFADTQFYSALSRKEGYVHNLPTDNRFEIVPKSPMSIQEGIPETRKWWPLWDTRKHITFVNAETTGISQQCNTIEQMLIDSRGSLTVELQQDLLYQIQKSGLVWGGPNKLKPMEPEHIERILGYPVNHTLAGGISLADRLQSLKYCFQTDTLGYHISGLKSRFPQGLTVLSIYSGIGGSEISLHRLGIHMRAVVSIEHCERNRRILKRWWNSSGQRGELVQIDNIRKLSSDKIEMLMKNFGGFDFIICQNPCNLSTKSPGDSESPNLSRDAGSLEGFDFTYFCEFVRVLQRVMDISRK